MFVNLRNPWNPCVCPVSSLTLWYVAKKGSSLSSAIDQLGLSFPRVPIYFWRKSFKFVPTRKLEIAWLWAHFYLTFSCLCAGDSLTNVVEKIMEIVYNGNNIQSKCELTRSEYIKSAK